eukprot:scaffold3076_cov117-Isochrysis_galbana.AAC.8
MGCAAAGGAKGQGHGREQRGEGLAHRLSVGQLAALEEGGVQLRRQEKDEGTHQRGQPRVGEEGRHRQREGQRGGAEEDKEEHDKRGVRVGVARQPNLGRRHQRDEQEGAAGHQQQGGVLLLELGLALEHDTAQQGGERHQQREDDQDSDQVARKVEEEVVLVPVDGEGHAVHRGGPGAAAAGQLEDPVVDGQLQGEEARGVVIEVLGGQASREPVESPARRRHLGRVQAECVIPVRVTARPVGERVEDESSPDGLVAVEGLRLEVGLGPQVNGLDRRRHRVDYAHRQRGRREVEL